MKQSVIYTKLFVILAAILMTSCEEDPIIPTVNFRNVTIQTVSNNMPEGIDNYQSLESGFRFCIGQSLYIHLKANQLPNGDSPYNSSVLYEYNTSTNKWNIAWYVSLQQIDELQNSGVQGDWEKADRLRMIAERIGYDMLAKGCGFNGKGYICYDDLTFEFDPLTNQITFYENGVGSMYNSKIFSNSEGVFLLSNNNTLLKYSTSLHQWSVIAQSLDEQLLRSLTQRNLILDTPEEANFYICINLSSSYSSIFTYTYPYTNAPSERTFEIPHDYGWHSDIYPNYSTGYGVGEFSINGKQYSQIDNKSFYEYNSSTNKVAVVIAGEDQNYYNSLPVAIIGNRLYTISDGRMIQYIAF